MYKEGNIIYFTPFYFKNGNTAKPKYFVVLKVFEEKNILASLPTRHDSIPKNNEIENGCIDLPDINLNCYVISENIEITECGKNFDFKTHIYGHQIDIHELSHLEEIYQIENSDYEIWGKMKQELFDELINCLRDSNTVKRKYRKILSD